MRKSFWRLAALALLAAFLLGGDAWAATADELKKHPGAKVFTDNKCNKCHAVKALKIALLKKDKESEQSIDLSNYGSEAEAAPTLKRFLARQIELKSSKDQMKKHKKKFVLKDADFDKLYRWLAELKFKA